MSAVLAAQGIEVSHGGTTVLRGVSLEVERGRVLGVLGPTGAGKTTLFRAMVGELRPQKGSVLLEGEDVTREPLWKRVRRGLGYMPQGPSVLPDLTVRQNLETFAKLRTTGRSEYRAEWWGERVGLGHRMELRASNLSGGERRQLELARALMAGPNVIVCDEPFSGIDPVGARRIAQLLRQQAVEGLAIVLADHHANLALEICDRAVLLVDGEFRREGLPQEMRNDPFVCERYLGQP